MSEPSTDPLDGDRIQVIQTSGLPPNVIPPSAALIPPGGEPSTNWAGDPVPTGNTASEPSIDPLDVEVGVEILNREGGRPGSDIHSWRCADKERYPEPCTCTEEVVAEILAAVLPAHDRRLLLTLADELYSDDSPRHPLSTAAWLRAKAEGGN